MFSAVLFAALAGSAVAAPIAQRAEPTGWATGYLESYDVYHTRYIALDCIDKHNTTFFEDCCHPLLSTENLSDNRKAYCVPSKSESASAATVSATATDDGADAAFMNATSSVESVYESVEATATAAVTTVTLSTSSIAEETSTSAVGDNAYAKHKTSTSEWSAPTTSSTYKWTATSTSSAAATTTASSGGSGSYSNTGGYATYFYQGGNAGACGTVHSDSDYIIAIDSNGWWSDYASNDNSQYCGKYINIKNTDNGNTVTAMVADVCPTCTNDNSLDLSVGAFNVLSGNNLGAGMLPIEWSFA